MTDNKNNLNVQSLPQIELGSDEWKQKVKEAFANAAETSSGGLGGGSTTGGYVPSTPTTVVGNSYYPYPQDTCPSCGRCRHCGRGGYWGRPYYPYEPYFTY